MTVVYFDGACPLCRAEISHYQRLDSQGALSVVDVSAPHVALPGGLDRERALRRFHVLDDEGRLLSGAAAFVSVWHRLPGWKQLARCAAFPGAVWLLERVYRAFLCLRPLMVCAFCAVQAGKNRIPDR